MGLLNINKRSALYYEKSENIEVDGTQIIKKSYKYGLINIENKEILPCVYDYIYNLEDDGTRIVVKYEKGGLVESKTGKIILECKFWGIQWLSLSENGTRRVYIDEDNWFKFNYKKWKVLDRFLNG